MPTPVPSPETPETARWSFAPTPLLPTYLTTIMAGPFHMVRDDHRMTLPDGSETVIPLGLGWGAGSQMLQPLAIAVIGGILASMILSLVITPAVHYYLAD